MEQTKTFYAYIDINNDMVAWEAAIGRLCSVDLLEIQGIFTVSLRQFSLLKKYVNNNNTQQLSQEFKIEKIRMSKFPKKVSRLRGIYFFSSKKHAQAIIGRWKGVHFKANNLSEVRFVKNQYTSSEFDSEWITSNLASNNTDWIERYLKGETYGENPLTEIVVSGCGLILNDALRQEAYDILAKKYPNALPILQLACLGFNQGIGDIGQVIPYLLNTGKTIKGVHIINMKAFKNGGQLIKMIDKNIIQAPKFYNWKKSMKTPDFRHLDFEFDIKYLPKFIKTRAI